MSAPTPTRFELPIRVGESDLDEVGHVNNVVYVQWVQDAAAGHWRHAATAEQLEGIVWVAVRHEIDYEAPSFAGDELVARTWVEAWSGATSERHTEIERVSDGVLLARARTIWCAVDPASGRPMRVRPEVKDRFSA